MMYKQAADTKLLSSSRGLGTRVRFATCSSKATLLEYFYVVHCLVGYANMVTKTLVQLGVLTQAHFC